MKRIDWSRYKPMGYTSPNVVSGAGALIFALIKTIELPFNIIGARDDLYPDGRLTLGVIPGEKMAPYLSLVGDSFRLFPLFWIVMALEVLSAYRYHKRDTMSIYLMRRLPDKWDLHRRCWGMPVILTIGSFLLMGAVLGLYYLVYLLLTPAGCLPY